MATSKQDDTVQDAAARVVEDAKSEGKRLLSEAKTAAVAAAEQRKDAAGNYVKALAIAAQGGARELDDHGHRLSASLLVGAAERLQGAADSIEANGIDDLWGEFEGLARHHPVIFYGSAFALGFGLTRWLKSTAETRTTNRDASSAGRGTPSERSVS